MNPRFYLIPMLLLAGSFSFAQPESYRDSTEAYLLKYVKEHEVVKGEDKKLMTFYPADEKYRIHCRFEKSQNAPWFRMESSGPVKKNYRAYGTIHFFIHDTTVVLTIYQGQDLMATTQYRNHLFIPFTDATSGEDTYESGRYIDLEIKGIENNQVWIDFNKAYNPYCAYVSGRFNCPIPPPENRLSVAILAGEKKFKQPH
jgi:uncharacterized protein